MDGPQPINHRHADFQSRLGSLRALYFKELPGRPLLSLQDNAELCIARSRKTHARVFMLLPAFQILSSPEMTSYPMDL
jgi:hypothetical protein